jgi:peroxiredoxin
MQLRHGTALIAALTLTSAVSAQAQVKLNVKAPELEVRTEDERINSKPLRLADLRGQVVVVHFWTFGCINCIHNQQHYRSWHEKFSEKGVTLIGVHTPETEGEKDIDALRQNAKAKKLKYPIVMDAGAQTWKTWETQWWPTTYLIDKNGVVRYRWDGELNWRKAKGEAIMRAKIEELLAEPASKP